ncbi:MAG: ABC transporter substrate-binding protein [Desulfobacteraceae bacterium 4572_130]|nr:MAG: ABC transporter substrate-binding protein [Desulfobacteraceae bacterium 4572_130]
MKRRNFLKKAAFGTAALAASTAVAVPSVLAKKKYNLKMVSTWPPKFPVFQIGLENFAKRVKIASEGQINIQTFAAGELVPAMQTFQAVSDGTVEVGSGASYYWAGKVRAAQWFAAVPFGLNAQGMNAWFYSGGGLKLWEEVYAPFNLIPRPIGNTGVQMGGWFNKKINTMADFKGLKMRIPGLGGKVFAKAGGTVTLSPGGEIFTNLERGVIDATEWVGPYHDHRLGLPKAAKYYYFPGWHEPGTVLEIMFNKKVYESMPKHLQMILDACAAQTNVWQLSEFEANNGEYLEKILAGGTKMYKFSNEIMATLRKLAKETLEEEAKKDLMSKKVNQAFKAFQKRIGAWGQFSEAAYHQLIAEKIKLKS